MEVRKQTCNTAMRDIAPQSEIGLAAETLHEDHLGPRRTSSQEENEPLFISNVKYPRFKDLSDMANGYDYRMIRSTARELRVLLTFPNPKPGKRIPLRCNLEHISLQDVPIKQFNAVLYCWGASKKRASIVIDGQRATIPTAASVVIRNLSQVSAYPLWIDAVCIDQNNIQEKSEQVVLMKDVYSNAVSVLIWLGPGKTSTADAIASIENIYQQCLDTIGGLEHLNTHLYGSDGSPGFKYSNAPLPDCDWPALRAFYSAPWFGRLWVLQEIGLAKDPICYIGSHSIAAQKVVLAARWMVHRLYSRYYGGSEHPGIESASNMWKPANRPLSNQLRRMHRAGCTLRHDKVYGLLGLLREETASAVITDYSRPLVDVYARAIRLALHEAGDLSFLQFSAWFTNPKRHKSGIERLRQLTSCSCLTSRYPEDAHWPSWVLKLHGETSDESGACRNVPIFSHSSMGASLALQTRILDDSLILSLRGLPIDTISMVSPAFSVDVLKDPSKLAEVVSWCVRHGRQASSSENPIDMKDLALCLSCGSNKVNRDTELDPEHSPAFVRFLQACDHLNDTQRKLSRKFDLLHHAPPQHLPDFWNNLWSKATNRRFFITSTGMIGMGPSATEAEDVATMMFGSETPFLLRPRGPYFELVGDAYMRAGGKSCNGKTWSYAAGYNAPAEKIQGNNLILAYAQERKADRWFDII